MKLFIFLSVAVFFIAACIYGERRAREKVKQRFLGRRSIDLDVLCGCFCQKDEFNKGRIKEILEFVAAELFIDPGVLRPEDRLDFELAPPDFDCEKDFWRGILKNVSKSRKEHIECAKIVTLDDYVCALMRLLEGHAGRII